MKGSTPKARGRHLNTVLKSLYDDEGKECNVIDILTDIRHLCDVNDWDYSKLDRIAYSHYSQERASGMLEPHFLP